MCRSDEAVAFPRTNRYSLVAATKLWDETSTVSVDQVVQFDCQLADVPDPDQTAVVDPHWLELRANGLLPDAYMPPTMAGSHPAWMRAIAACLISVFMFATALGLCLTYGPPTGW